MTIKIYAHNPHSEGAKNLAEALGVRRIKHEGSTWRPRLGDKVVNWGGSQIPDFQGVNVAIINPPTFVRRTSNKLTFFEIMDGANEDDPRIPAYCTNIDHARRWIQEGHKVVCRTLLTSHSGNGIVIAEMEDQLVQAPLYTRYVKKQAEYRVHIVRGRVIDVQRKIRDPDNTPTDWHVRSHANGFIFVRGSAPPPDDVTTQCLRAFRASGLDFGAVDVIINRAGEAFVLEINTAPGLTGTTVTNYADAFRREFF